MELSDRRDQDEAWDRGRVLIVDDSRFVRAVVARHLKNAGFLVQEADPGATAMKILSGAAASTSSSRTSGCPSSRGGRRRRRARA